MELKKFSSMLKSGRLIDTLLEFNCNRVLHDILQ